MHVCKRVCIYMHMYMYMYASVLCICMCTTAAGHNAYPQYANDCTLALREEDQAASGELEVCMYVCKYVSMCVHIYT
jgi:hypothetical protein